MGREIRYSRIIYIGVFALIVLWWIISYKYTNLLQSEYKGILLSTEVELKILHTRTQDGKGILQGFEGEIKRLGKILSSYDKSSELSKLNAVAGAGGWHKASKELLYVIKEGLRYAKLSEGAFDISIYPLLRLWNAGDRADRSEPSKEAIMAAKALVDYKKIEIRADKIRYLKKGLKISLGGLSKGYIIDKAISYLKGRGISSCLLNIGGDTYGLGSSISGGFWHVGIKNPREGEYGVKYLGKVPLNNESLTTSGDYARYRITKGGKRVNHIIDPKTGYPVGGVVSVSTLSNSALQSDAISTIVFLLGADKGFKLVKGLVGVESLIVYEVGEEEGVELDNRSVSNYSRKDYEGRLKFLITEGFKLEAIEENN